MRKTKIICTLGPATEQAETIEQMIAEGADIFRLNMSHATHKWVREIVPRVREIARQRGRAVAILLDMQGPAIRTGEIDSKLPLRVGDVLEFTVRGAKPKETNSVSVNYDVFIDDVSVGDKVLVDNGVIQLRVLGKGEDRVRCKVLTAGTLSSRRHINLPGVYVNLPPLTGKDLKDVALGAELAVDFVALSFVRQKSDLEELRKVLKKLERAQLSRHKVNPRSSIAK
jgi:pyruvate kinase